MLKNIKKIIFLVSVVLFIVIGGVGIYDDSSRLLDIDRITQNEIDDIVQKRVKNDLPVEITFKGEKLQYCRNTDMYYISQSLNNEEWQGGIMVSSGYNCHIFDGGLSKNDIITGNIPLKLFVYNDTSYDIKNIVVSGLPVVSLSFSHRENTDDYGQITVFEPDASGRTNVLGAETYFCRWHMRGATSLKNPKKSYKLNILNSSGKSKKVSLLNMREDNDWVLNAMYTDRSKTREMLCNDIWSNISADFTHSMEYCELIIDGQYMGLYALREPVDNKTFQRAKSTSVMIYIKGWHEKLTDMMLFEEDAFITLRDEKGINGELTLDSCNYENIDDALEILRWLRNPSYESRQINVWFDRDNLLNYTLFCNLTKAEDNTYKNQKICAIGDSRGNYTLYKSPWDMDITFGNETIDWIGSDAKGLNNDNFYIENRKDNLLLKEKYFQARDNFWNEEYIYSFIDNNYSVLTETGAFARENSVWPCGNLKENCDYLKGFVSERIEALDEYYGGM